MENFSGFSGFSGVEDFFKRMFGGSSVAGNSQMDSDNETARREMMKDADLGWAYQPNISDFAPKSPGDVGGYVQYGDPRIAGPIVSPYAPANQAALYGGAEVGDITTVPGADFLKKRQKRGLMGWA